MVNTDDKTPTGLLLSGGLDSAILLGRFVRAGVPVLPFYVRGGLAWEDDELRAAQAVARAVDGGAAGRLLVFDLPLGDLYGDHWSVTGAGVPGAGTPDEAVYLPGRNLLLILKAAVWCRLHGLDRLALGVLGSNPFADASPDFFDRLEGTVEMATGGRVRILRPFADLTKRQVMELGADLPLELTFSCIAPVCGLHCGCCNKCSERKAAFHLAGRADPTRYATRTNRLPAEAAPAAFLHDGPQ
jgi:7-cyano-7-deazaguanine synthase